MVTILSGRWCGLGLPPGLSEPIQATVRTEGYLSSAQRALLEARCPERARLRREPERERCRLPAYDFVDPDGRDGGVGTG